MKNAKNAMPRCIRYTYNFSCSFQNDARSTSAANVLGTLFHSEMAHGSGADDWNASVLPEMCQNLRLLCNRDNTHVKTSMAKGHGLRLCTLPLKET